MSEYKKQHIKRIYWRPAEQITVIEYSAYYCVKSVKDNANS